MQTTEKNNHAGYLSKVELENTTILNIFTKAGGYRGGKIYSEEKTFLILSGEVEVTTYEGEQDRVRKYNNSDGLITIPAHIPNIFYFPKDSEMLEWFRKNVKTERYERYSEMKK
ncbi:cupin domain-containing protein [Candidatus Gracilibacteria bacterium]|nr:cupin domain-containing protein [Candidatus Gracilibacteria bacterium]